MGQQQERWWDSLGRSSFRDTDPQLLHWLSADWGWHTTHYQTQIPLRVPDKQGSMLLTLGY